MNSGGRSQSCSSFVFEVRPQANGQVTVRDPIFDPVTFFNCLYTEDETIELSVDRNQLTYFTDLLLDLLVCVSFQC